MAQKFNKLANQHILILGGSSGVGFAVTQGALASGASVTISSSSLTKLETKAHELRADFPDSSIYSHVCDLSNLDALEAQIENLLTTNGPFDHVVFTAGDAHDPKPISDITIDHVIRAGKVRFFAPLFLAKHLPSHLRAKSNKCSLTLTNSWSAARSTGGWPVEHAYTVALSGLVQTLAIDLKPVRVNVVGLGLVDTEIFETGGMNKGEKEGMFEGVKGTLLTGSVPGPECAAETFLGVLRDESVTGSSLYCDSGMRLANF